MKLQLGDQVQIMAGKDWGKRGEITLVFPKINKVVVAGMNMYTRHVKPYGGQPGDKVRRERSLPASKVAIINDKDKPDRIGYKLTKDGKKQRVYRKTGTVIPAKKITPAVKKTAKPAKS